MAKTIVAIIKILLLTALLAGMAVLLAQKIDLTTADIGRHIQNGNILVNGSWPDKWAVLHTNFYSFSLPAQPFINHHWGSGVVFYWFWLATGFIGLSLMNILAAVLTLFIFFKIAARGGQFWLTAALGFLLVPTMAFRQEVRPEMFTYLFCAVTLYLLWEFWQNRLSRKWLYLLPGLQLLWVNLHIGFIFGIFILGAFGLEELWNLIRQNGGLKFTKQDFLASKFWALFRIGLLEALAVLINPAGIKGALVPFFIFKNYGYLIVENQSVRFLENLGFGNGLNFLPFKAAFGLLILSFILLLIFKRKKISIALLALSIGFSFAAWTALRNFPMFGFFALPIMAYNFNWIIPKKIILPYKLMLAAAGIAIAGFGFSQGYLNFQEKRETFGVGLTPNVGASAEFAKAENLQGPIFNNYDIGGYLVYSLAEKHGLGQQVNTDKKVFVDNRPEAYSADFLQKVYVASQEDETKWQALDKQYNFNVIFFSHRDYTPWAQAFLIRRVSDKDWAPVFADSYNIIFLRRDNLKNADIIKKYEIPKSMFGISAKD